MGKVFRLTCQVNLLLPCFGLSVLYCTCQHLTLPTGITSLPYTKHLLKWSCCLYGGGQLVQISTKTHWPPSFSYLGFFLSMAFCLRESPLIIVTITIVLYSTLLYILCYGCFNGTVEYVTIYISEFQ